MRALKFSGSAMAGLVLLTIGILGPLPQDVEAQGLMLRTGDYAAYSLGDPADACRPTTPLYPPLFGMENRTFAGACPGTIHWEVLGATDSGVDVRLVMSGWPMDDIHFEGEPDASQRSGEQLYGTIHATLNAEHVLRIDLSTLDVTTLEGRYVGRWSFHVSSAEVASEHLELVRHWYEGTSISANVTVVKELPLEMSGVLGREYGVETFVFAQTGWIDPVPEGIERYLYETGGGWQRLRASAPVYDASSSLLLVTLSPFYSDLLFNLYGVFWLDQLIRPWPDARPLTSLILVDTNVITLPGSPGSEGLDDPNTGSDPGTTASPEGPPWAMIILFAAIAVTVVLLAYRRLRPRRKDETNRVERDRDPAERRGLFSRGKG